MNTACEEYKKKAYKLCVNVKTPKIFTKTGLEIAKPYDICHYQNRSMHAAVVNSENDARTK